MLLALTLLATVGLKIAHERADTLERMQAEKFAANLAKAYVVDSASAAAHGDKSAGAAAKGVVQGLQPETYRKSDPKERQQAPVVVPFDSSEVEFEMSTREETAALIAVSTGFRVFGREDRRCGSGIGGKEVEVIRVGEDWEVLRVAALWQVRIGESRVGDVCRSPARLSFLLATDIVVAGRLEALNFVDRGVSGRTRHTFYSSATLVSRHSHNTN